MAITGNIINNSDYSWEKYPSYTLFQDEPGGSAIQHTANIAEKPRTKGRFVFILPKGTTGYVNVQGYDDSGNMLNLCELKVTSIDTSHATIEQIGGDTSGLILCQYSGDPSNNTATITLINNQKV
ncbi:MAG: hypothetical protein HOK80_09280 [Candidatus Cloacimonetes bacterium]|nr:hypothetical protein [Candidatus Cloacimonadota bacterium]